MNSLANNKNTVTNLKSPDKAESGKIILIPQPPMCAMRPGNCVRSGENVVITLLDGKKVLGKIDDFNSMKGELLLQANDDEPQKTIALQTVKIFYLRSLRQWVQSESHDSSNEEALTLPDGKQDFEVNFKDGDKLEGDSMGARTDRNGLFLFPAQNNNQYICAFIPNEAMKDYRIGPRIGEMLIEDNLVSEEQIDEVLNAQEEDRSTPLGEFLRTKAVVTTMELEKALAKQKSAPNLRLGEILTSENLISEEQLNEALDAQKENRSKPLGEILVDKGLVSTAEIQQSLAKKLCIPFMDLSKFEIDQEAINLVPEELIRQHSVLPLYSYDGKLVIVMENPMAWDAIDAVRFHTNLYIEPVMAPLEEIEKTINFVFSSFNMAVDETSLDDFDFEEDDVIEDEEDLVETSMSDNIVVKLVNKIIVDAHRRGASDIHIEPYPGKDKTVVRIRIDGSLVHYYDVPPNLKNAIVARIKVMSTLDISERRKPQDGKIDFKKFSKLKIELRVATIPTAGGQEDVVMRILAGGEPIPIDKLGLSKSNHDRLLNIVSKPYGLFFVCGPTGSGKTTTLHSILGHLNTPERKIWTAEDPVEITQKGLRQVQVQPKIGFDFSAAMRAFLRADPDIIMVGEMRDKETTKTGIEASLTGHLVFTTLHTNTAPESIVRLLDMGMDPFNFADALLGVLAQRLTRCLCSACKEAHKATDEEIDDLLAEYYSDQQSSENIDEIKSRTKQEWYDQFSGEDGSITLYHAKGCDECAQAGYKGRVGIHELLDASDTIKKNILEKATVSELLSICQAEGMTTLKQDGIEKVLQGITDIHQIRKVCIK